MSLRRPPRVQRTVTDPADLSRVWRALLATEPYRVRTVWLLFLDPVRRPAGPVLTVDDVPDGPYDLQVADLVATCREILDGPGGGGSVALLMSRPGGAPWTVSDRAWGRFLGRAASAIGGTVWPVHQAHRYGLEELAAPVARLRAAAPGSPLPGPAAAPAR